MIKATLGRQIINKNTNYFYSLNWNCKTTYEGHSISNPVLRQQLYPFSVFFFMTK